MMPESLRQIVYISAALTPPDAAMLREIFDVSYRNNERRRITGLLLHVEGSFMQALEGDHHVLEELMQRIARDRRHKSLSILLDEAITQRSFGAWAMALGDVSCQEVALLPGMSDFLRQPPKISGRGQSPAILLLETFKKTNARLIRPG